MDRFIIKKNHSLNELLKIQSDYVMICESEKHLYKSNMLEDFYERSEFSRPVTILENQRITTYEQLIQHSEYSLMAFDGMGKKSITAIKDFLQHKGLVLRFENAEELAIIAEQKRIASEERSAEKERKAEEKRAAKVKMTEKTKIERAAFEEKCRIQQEKNKKLAYSIRAENARIEAERAANPIMFRDQ
jgi:hypothetical protein